MHTLPPAASAPADGSRRGDALRPRRAKPLHVPIRVLHAMHRPQILAHLLALSAHDRYLRFGYPASDSQIERYVQTLNFARDEIYGVVNRKLALIAMAHLAFDAPQPGRPQAAEFGVSVLGAYRGRGLGAKLYERAMVHARNKGVQTLYIHALSENAPMLRIARNAGASVHREGSESEAYLKLPPPDLGSHLSEAWEDQIAELDYHLKLQAFQVQTYLDALRLWSGAAAGPSKRSADLATTDRR